MVIITACTKCALLLLLLVKNSCSVDCYAASISDYLLSMLVVVSLLLLISFFPFCIPLPLTPPLLLPLPLPLLLSCLTNLFTAIRANLGGRLKVMISGGSMLPPHLENFFDKTGLNVSKPGGTKSYARLNMFSLYRSTLPIITPPP